MPLIKKVKNTVKKTLSKKRQAVEEKKSELKISNLVDSLCNGDLNGHLFYNTVGNLITLIYQTSIIANKGLGKNVLSTLGVISGFAGWGMIVVDRLKKDENDQDENDKDENDQDDNDPDDGDDDQDDQD